MLERPPIVQVDALSPWSVPCSFFPSSSSSLVCLQVKWPSCIMSSDVPGTERKARGDPMNWENQVQKREGERGREREGGRGRGNSYIVDWTTVLYSTSLTYPCVLQFLWEVLPGSTQSDQSPWVIKRPGSFVLRPRPPSVHSTPTEMHWEVWWACWTERHWWRPVVVLLVDN